MIKGILGTRLATYRAAVLRDSTPAGLWLLNDSDISGTNQWQDSSGNGHHAADLADSLNPTPTTTTLRGGLSSCASFDGTNDYISVPYTAVYASSTTSIETWIKVGAGQSFWTIAGIGDESLSTFWWVRVTSTAVQFNRNGITYSLTASVMDDNWHHIVWTYSSTTFAAWIDGVSIGSTSNGGNLGTPSPTTSITIGADYHLSTVKNFKVGQLAGLAIHPNTVLTGTQAAAHYAAGCPATIMSGGTLTESNGYRIHTFTLSGTLTVLENPSAIEYLVVAGGGAGGSSTSTYSTGGGGGGGMRSGSTTLAVGTHSITVGQGGTAQSEAAGSNGGSSSIAGVATTTGGGGGGTGIGSSGGSGGGGGNAMGASGGGGGTGTSGEGNNGGGASNSAFNRRGGGGGGAGGGGGNGGDNSPGAGGAGSVSSISGSSITYAGGGGAMGSGNFGAGGSGGGGAGGNLAAGTAGTNSRGGGGGGGFGSAISGGAGGSGVVVIRYPHKYGAWLRSTYSPMLHIPMDTTDPTLDLTGNSRDLDWTSTAPTTGVLLDSGGVTLAGTTDSRFNNGSYASWMGTIRTIGCWVKFTSTSDISLWSGRPSSNLFACYHDNTNGLRVLFGYNSGIDVDSYGSSNFKINDGNLHSVIVAWTTSSYALYVDGVTKASGTLSHTYSPSALVSWGFGGGDGGGRKFIGQIGHGFALTSTLTLSDAQAIDARGRIA